MRNPGWHPRLPLRGLIVALGLMGCAQVRWKRTVRRAIRSPSRLDEASRSSFRRSGRVSTRPRPGVVEWGAVSGLGLVTPAVPAGPTQRFRFEAAGPESRSSCFSTRVRARRSKTRSSYSEGVLEANQKLQVPSVDGREHNGREPCQADLRLLAYWHCAPARSPAGMHLLLATSQALTHFNGSRTTHCRHSCLPRSTFGCECWLTLSA